MMDTVHGTPHNSKTTKRSRFKTTTVLLIVFLTGLFAVLYFQSRSEINRLRHSASQYADEAEKIVRKIEVYMLLPKQKPTIATVKDTKKLADQPFFKDARNGDKVLIYTRIKKAILYRPSDNKVIEVAYMRVDMPDKER